MSTAIKPLIHLKPSRLRLGLNCVCAVAILLLCFTALDLLFFVLCACLFGVCIGLKSRVIVYEVRTIQHLHQHEWSIQRKLGTNGLPSQLRARALKSRVAQSRVLQNRVVQNREDLEQREVWIYALDYGMCMLFYKKDQTTPLIIWRDQVQSVEWKYLKQVQQQLH